MVNIVEFIIACSRSPWCSKINVVSFYVLLSYYGNLSYYCG